MATIRGGDSGGGEGDGEGGRNLFEFIQIVVLLERSSVLRWRTMSEGIGHKNVRLPGFHNPLPSSFLLSHHPPGGLYYLIPFPTVN